MSTSSFVDQLYRTFLYRDPDDVGKAYWVNRIDTGDISASAVTYSFLQSTEYSQRVSALAELYFLFFNRIPDEDGMKHWQSRLDGGVSYSDIAALFMASQEYHDKYGGAATDAEFLELIYLNVLGRIPDNEGREYWNEQFAAGETRAAVITALSQSTEFLATSRPKVMASSIYFAMLDRLPTNQELETAIAGDYQAGLIDQLFASSEYTGETPPALFKVQASATAFDESVGKIDFTVTRDGFISDRATVTYDAVGISAQPDADFGISSGTIVFEPGETSKTISVSVIDDTQLELEESFYVTFTAPSPAVFPDSRIDLSINRNDQIPARTLDNLTPSSPLATFQGTVDGQKIGHQVASVGDVNGDGFDDLIFTQSGDANGVANNWLIFGRAGGWDQSVALDSLSGTDGVLISGAGTVVHAAGDVNSDSFADLIISNPSASPDGRLGAGESYLLFGHDGAWDETFDTSSLNGTNGTVLKGVAGDSSGQSVSNIGDVNGDTIDDLLIGAPNALPVGNTGEQHGQVYLVFGLDNTWNPSIDLATLNGTRGFVIEGLNGNQLGSSVTNIGDINGDMISDLLISEAANVTSSNGKTVAHSYLIFGRDGGWSDGIDLNSLTVNDGIKIVLPDNSSDITLNSAGDVNGDGRPDILIGAPNANNGEGQAFLIFGKQNGWDPTIYTSELNGTDGVIFQGAFKDGHSGQAIDGLGDVNKDGFDDFFIGHDTGGYLVYGRAQGWGSSYELYSYSTADTHLLEVVDKNSPSQLSVSNAGDINKDGYADFLLGDQSADGSSSTDIGNSYLVFGSDQLFF